VLNSEAKNWPQILSLDGNWRLQLHDEGVAVLRQLRMLRELSVRKYERLIGVMWPPDDQPWDDTALRWDGVSVRHLAALAAEFATAQPQPKTLTL
jgi:hypothetical protein